MVANYRKFVWNSLVTINDSEIVVSTSSFSCSHSYHGIISFLLNLCFHRTLIFMCSSRLSYHCKVALIYYVKSFYFCWDYHSMCPCKSYCGFGSGVLQSWKSNFPLSCKACLLGLFKSTKDIKLFDSPSSHYVKELTSLNLPLSHLKLALALPVIHSH